MNTHADGLYVKEKTLVNLESAKPAVDKISRWVYGREVKEILGSTSLCKLQSTVATLFSFIISKQENMDLQVKENIKSILQYIQRSPGNKSPWTKYQSRNTKIYIIIQMYKYIQIYNAWQTSLMLGSLGRALRAPIAFSGSNLGFDTPCLLRQKCNSPYFGSFKKRTS